MCYHLFLFYSFRTRYPLYFHLAYNITYCIGDGVADDTAAFQNVMNQYANTDKVIFIDAGSYILTDTITIPPGAKIVGECWAQLVAMGSKFNDANNPRPLLRVGAAGSTGSMEIQDLLFTSKVETAGLVMVEWNIKGSSLGSAAMWGRNSHLHFKFQMQHALI